MNLKVFAIFITNILGLLPQTGTMPLDEIIAPSIFNYLPQKQATKMLSYMNISMDPCEDFYEFACGNFAQAVAPIEATRLQILGHTINDYMQKLMERFEIFETDLDRNVKNFYRSCVNVQQLLPDYPAKLKELVKEFGQMPLISGDEWHENDFNWQETVARIAYKMNIPIILKISIEPDFANNTKSMVTLTQAPLNFITKKNYIEMPDHLKYIMALKLVKYFGIDETLAQETASEMFEFELSLMHAMTDDISTLQNFEIYETVNMEKLQSQYNASWDSMKLIQESLNFKPSHVNANQKYLKNLAQVLANTPKHVVANHIFYSYLCNFLIRIRPSKSEMSKHCLTHTKNYFYKYLENKIYRKYFTEDMQQVIHLLWEELKISFEYTLQKSWLQPETRQKAVEKLKAMTIKIDSYQDVNFTAEYQDLNLLENDFVHNMKSLHLMQGRKAQAKINQTSCSVEMGAASASTPSYSEMYNQLNIPVAILQPFYFYSTNYPYAFNFGSLGSYLAHEILHGFDDNGRNYDAHGNNLKCWDLKSSMEFEQRTQCFVEQYKSYIFNGSPLPEMKLQSENIADNGGIRLAYEAYRMWYNKNAENQTISDFLPFLELTHTQLFFLSYGQTWCSSENPDDTSSRLNSDPHVPHKFRVIGPLSNFIEFSQEFNCPTGSVMNPVKKCEIY